MFNPAARLLYIACQFGIAETLTHRVDDDIWVASFLNVLREFEELGQALTFQMFQSKSKNAQSILCFITSNSCSAYVLQSLGDTEAVPFLGNLFMYVLLRSQ